MLSGILHLLVVSFMHRENFIELWYFTVVGALQIFLAFHDQGDRQVAEKRIKLLIVIHSALVMLWLLTRLFNAPFAIYPEAFAQFDIWVACAELVAVVAGVSILKGYSVSRKTIAGVLLLGSLIGGMNYGLAKASEKVFQSISISQDAHRHSFWEMFQKPEITTQTIIIDSQDPESGEIIKEIIEKPTVAPSDHDNSDGHHDTS